MTLRKLPEWLAGGPVVSDTAYRLVELALDDHVNTRGLGLAEQVEHLAVVLEVDEADVLRAWAELERVGVLIVNRKGQG